MKVTKEQKTQWDQLYDHGDIKLIADDSGIDRRIISDAMAGGNATEQVIDAIHKFYLARKLKNDQRIAEMNGTATNEAA